jgi:hypothetical protein
MPQNYKFRVFECHVLGKCITTCGSVVQLVSKYVLSNWSFDLSREQTFKPSALPRLGFRAPSPAPPPVVPASVPVPLLSPGPRCRSPRATGGPPDPSAPSNPSFGLPFRRCRRRPSGLSPGQCRRWRSCFSPGVWRWGAGPYPLVTVLLGSGGSMAPRLFGQHSDERWAGDGTTAWQWGGKVARGRALSA